jgi:hypothetical protein
MSDLLDRRLKFTRLICQLIEWGNSQPDWQIAIGRDYDETHEKYRHMAKSLHYQGLANDLCLYIKGVYQTDTEAYRKLGEKWLQMDVDCRWGGMFTKPDGNHFSISMGGLS